MSTWFNQFRNLFRTHRKHKDKPIDLIEVTEDDYNAWWNTYLIENEQSRYWQIGSVVLLLDHFNHEWHITSYQGQLNPSDSPIEPTFTNPVRTKTITTHQTDANEVTFRPSLPDRPVVYPIGKPFVLPAKEVSHLYASTPLWISVTVGKPFLLLDEIPIEIMQETWHGKNTLEGELCYYGPLCCTTRIEETPKDTIHCTTPLIIVNHTKNVISLKDIRLPVPNLSIYSDPVNRLWTEKVIITFENNNLMTLTILKGPPKGLKDATRLVQPRFNSKPGFKGFF